ncbi:MAG: hypothetical protein COZ06_39090 [Armatimonadetes bacterium CG_4_10_14_3_um_filter_66_18]|nr:hypothetical protein [Armatimonadota bacterium]PIU92444.1 MAG: hypothetical protein COS65_17870 [Armatimonadetes bacterium CG06_land_8_20_14_3_00_66_21]PIX40204.1 MAG: hypothetical protein COZ57_26535 [Armatimonadetes bacterium CG_4_8_14_3_um_filter_66_20]PIY34979.1 MAG: hypothetical protein COZ06_39090 [Armatimonadetes bacterium CG_4_10_14_3_um_filter_66_18]PIZ36693.1 MAG: hypothetical protein COY42_25100 [Armatimonadetes bacterium CG_4_10_14_0_8_um_filter_66_14]PJB60462.1 MAG: hypothetica
MPYINPNKLPELLQEFLTHATKYAPAEKAFAGVTKTDLQAALTDLVAKRDAKAEADRKANIAGAEFDTAADTAHDQMVRYRAGAKAELGPNAEGTVTLPKLSAKRSSKSSSTIVPPTE